MRLRTPLTELIGIEHPVVQTGMGWVAGARLVSATANAGGLGILASATMTLDELAAAITKVKAVTDKPFGVNIRADAADAGDRVELMIREGVRVASFALAPKQQLIARLKEAGAVVIPSIGAAKHARKVAAWGADAMIVQGGEGGGHTGPVATTLLLPSVLDAVAGTGIPVIAAGGFFDGRGLAAALCYGAAGVAMGHPVSAHLGFHRARRGQTALPAGRLGRHRGHHPRRRDAAPGAAHRAGREAGKRLAGTRFRGRAAQCRQV
ncbi:oxidoreductase [Mycobacterium tuberculosis MD16765]|nr:oxidoreductase [Mycobacterium tuberculosis MD16765]